MSTSLVLADVFTSVVIKGCPLVLSLGDVSTILVIVLCVFVIRGIFYQPGLLPFAMVRIFSTSTFTVCYSGNFYQYCYSLLWFRETEIRQYLTFCIYFWRNKPEVNSTCCCYFYIMIHWMLNLFSFQKNKKK